jgi:hypothetical protein
MFALSHVQFGLGIGGRSRHIAKRADGIYRFIWIDAVEELMKVHILSCIIGPHDWIPKRRGCTAREKTEVASPQSAFQHFVTSHPILLKTATLFIRPDVPCGPIPSLLPLRTTTLRKSLRSPVQNLHRTLPPAGAKAFLDKGAP